jgi:hypothetical protein
VGYFLSLLRSLRIFFFAIQHCRAKLLEMFRLEKNPRSTSPNSRRIARCAARRNTRRMATQWRETLTDLRFWIYDLRARPYSIAARKSYIANRE